jgi:glucose/arabinose dehydrogenase
MRIVNNNLGKFSLRFLLLTLTFIVFGVFVYSWWPLAPAAMKLPPALDTIKLPPGFAISVYAREVPSARQMALGSRGTVFVGSNTGSIFAVVDRNHDHQADQVLTIATGLSRATGVAFHDGTLYVAEIHRILRYDQIEDRLENPPQPVVVNDNLPNDRWHGWKFIAFGPDGLLYVPVGAPCNVCEREEPFATLLRMKPDGSNVEVFARGIRNTVGFDWHPVGKELWFTDNGRDMLGDNVPPDELNRVPQKGLHFGFPYCHAGEIPDSEFGRRRKCDEFVAPAQKLGPHVAAIGMRFYTGAMFPPEYRNQIFIAEHGSWNRSEPIGYRVVLVRLDESGTRAVKYENFAEGWLQQGRAWGRPADVLVMSDGALLVSDDSANTIYRISYKGSH